MPWDFNCNHRGSRHLHFSIVNLFCYNNIIMLRLLLQKLTSMISMGLDISVILKRRTTIPLALLSKSMAHLLPKQMYSASPLREQWKRSNLRKFLLSFTNDFQVWQLALSLIEFSLSLIEFSLWLM